MILKNQNFVENDHIIDFKIKDPITSKVGNFYELDPFPNYELTDNKLSILCNFDLNFPRTPKEILTKANDYIL